MELRIPLSNSRYPIARLRFEPDTSGMEVKSVTVYRKPVTSVSFFISTLLCSQNEGCALLAVQVHGLNSAGCLHVAVSLHVTNPETGKRAKLYALACVLTSDWELWSLDYKGHYIWGDVRPWSSVAVRRLFWRSATFAKSNSEPCKKQTADRAPLDGSCLAYSSAIKVEKYVAPKRPWTINTYGVTF